MICKMKRPSAMISLHESDLEKEATRKRQRTHTDSSTLQAALLLALSAELQNVTQDLTVKPSQSYPSLCEKPSSFQNFVTSSQVHHHDHDTMTFSTISPNILTSQQFLDRCSNGGEHQKLNVANPTIKTSSTTSTRITTLPSGKPLLAPPRLPHLKLGERLSRQKCGWNLVVMHIGRRWLVGTSCE